MEPNPAPTAPRRDVLWPFIATGTGAATAFLVCVPPAVAAVGVSVAWWWLAPLVPTGPSAPSLPKRWRVVASSVVAITVFGLVLAAGWRDDNWYATSLRNQAMPAFSAWVVSENGRDAAVSSTFMATLAALLVYAFGGWSRNARRSLAALLVSSGIAIQVAWYAAR